MAANTTLSVRGLSAGYGGRTVLNDLGLDVNGGQILALVGPNGTGKSTLMRALSGVLPVRAGVAMLDGHDLLRLPPARRARLLAVVPQLARLPEAFSVADIVLMGRTPYLPLWAGESRADCKIAWRAMVRTGIDTLADRRVDELSGGEQQRVVIARALAQQPRVLLLDEPTAHLDLKHQVSVLDLVRSLARDEGLAVLMTLHDLNQAAQYAGTIALMHHGAIVAQGAPSEVLTEQRLSHVYGLPITLSRHPLNDTVVVLPGALS